MADSVPAVPHKQPWINALISKVFCRSQDDFALIQDEFVKTSRQLRRLQLAQENLTELTGAINQRLVAVDQKLMTAGAAPQKKSFPLAILDELEKLEKISVQTGGASASIVENIKKLILSEWKLDAVERLGAFYNKDRSEVSLAISHDEYASGTVLEIIRQGYVCDHSCIRKAIVVVAQ